MMNEKCCFELDGVCSVYMQQILPKSCHKAIKMMIFYELKKQLDIRFHFLTLFSNVQVLRVLIADRQLEHTKQFP